MFLRERASSRDEDDRRGQTYPMDS